MGVDLQTYRARIGTYRNLYGIDVATFITVVNFGKALKAVGSVAFIGILLIIAGVEQNPGPILPDKMNKTNIAQSTKIKVSNLPTTTTEEHLIMFFENENRHGGGKIKEIKLDQVTQSAVIDFENVSDVERVLGKQPIVFHGTIVSIDIITMDISNQTKIKVSNLPEGTTADFLIMFFENEHRQGGGKVRDVKLDGSSTSAVIEFEDISAVNKVLRKQPIRFGEKKVDIQIIALPNNAIENDNSQQTKIKVSDLPVEITEEYLIMFFENENRQGGGKVRDIKMDEDNRSAVVNFEDVTAVEKVLRKQPIVLRGTTVNIEKLSIQRTKIKVSNLPREITEDFLLMFFENEHREGGGKVRGVQLDKRDKSAIIDFEDVSAVGKVMRKQPIVLLGVTVAVQVFDQQSTIDTTEGKQPDEINNTILDDSGKDVSDGKKAEFPKESQNEQDQQCMIDTTEGKQADGIDNTILNDSGDGKKVILPQEFKNETDQQSIIYTREGKQQDGITSTILDDTREYLSDGKTAKLPQESINESDQKCMIFSTEGKQHDGITNTNLDDTSEDLSDNNTANISQESINESDEHKQESQVLVEILQKLGLENKYPGKFTLQDVISVDPNEFDGYNKKCRSLDEIPLMMLKRLICAHSESRDITVFDDTLMDSELDILDAFPSDSPETGNQLSPLDIFNIVFQCCDPMLKQIVVHKLYLCKLAVPFLTKIASHETLHFELSVWPLRSLTVENKLPSSSGNTKCGEVSMLDLGTKLMGFARYGRPRYSKSKLLNSLLSSQGCKTFFNIDCQSGMTPRSISNGTVEMFWLPNINDEKDTFKYPMTFLNVRGDLSEDFDEHFYSFFETFIDSLMIFVDHEAVFGKSKSIENIICRFSSVILVIADQIKPGEIKKLQHFKERVENSKKGINLRIVSTHKGQIEQNVVDMVSSISRHISAQLTQNKLRSLQDRLDSLSTYKSYLKSDEENKYCKQAHMNAMKLVRKMRTDAKSANWKRSLTPVHCVYSCQLGRLMKKQEREKDQSKINQIQSEMQSVLGEQIKAITPHVRLFIEILIRMKDRQLTLKMFLRWLHYYIEKEKLEIIPNLMYENSCAWEKHKEIKSKDKKEQSEIDHQEKVIKEVEQKIDDASFSIDHFFREIGHIYEAMLVLNKNPKHHQLPSLDSIAKLIGNLVVDGHQLELIDGESFYMPTKWTKAVLEHVDRYISHGKVVTLSILGLQSSGKSTLLNTMFGSQFLTRTGRCTRGIHLQLIPTVNTRKNNLPFDYILIADTEGLRSPELSHIQHEHDNELSTVITGIGDLTIFNIMGENTSEIRDILQVIVHAFIRLQMTNTSLDMRKSCAFIHQNVTDTSASANMLTGVNKLVKTLDEMTKEAAQSEGFLDIRSFNQIIEFDINSQVCYLKNLWQDNPPMARVNVEYSEKVIEFKCNTIQKLKEMKGKSFKTVVDIFEHAHGLWKGVLNEDFVFSFRNSLEIKAYIEMEEIVQKQIWDLESCVHTRLIEITHNTFASCNQENELGKKGEELRQVLETYLIDKRSEVETFIKEYFETNNFKDITIQWQQSQTFRIDTICQKMLYVVGEHVEKCYQKRAFELITVTDQAKHEAELHKKSVEVAERYKGKPITQNQIDSLFGKIWESFISKVNSSTEQHRLDFRNVFLAHLTTRLRNNHALLKEALSQSLNFSPLKPFANLAASVPDVGINENDISLSTYTKLKNYIIKSDKLSYVKKRIIEIFENIDGSITKLLKVNDELTEMAVKDLIRELDTSLQNIVSDTSDFSFKITLSIKILVHVSRYAYPLFDNHNDTYFKTRGIAARLEKLRVEQKMTFEAHINDRLSEDSATDLLCTIIKSFVKDHTDDTLPNKISDKLWSHFPQVKSRAILDICEDLLENEKFRDFRKYIHSPKSFAKRFFAKKADVLLFESRDCIYSNTANESLDNVFDKMKQSIISVKSKCKEEPNTSMKTWIQHFEKELKEESMAIESEKFRNLPLHMSEVHNVEYFTKTILEKLKTCQQQLKDKYKQVTSATVRWSMDPVNKVVKRIWGCDEQCAFCNEPCAKNEDHNNSDHYSLQHRPSCCSGTRDSKTKQGSVTTCPFDIKTNKTHKCVVFKYKCNKDNQTDCSDKTHRYRDFKTFLPDWDIQPSSDMYESSKFWLWFIVRFKKDLISYYNIKLDEIPSHWKDISKEDAKKSLKVLYNV